MKDLLIDRLPERTYLILRWWEYRINRKRQHQYAQGKRHLITDSGSSYLPFDENKTIFVHIPKCAGIAVNYALFGNLAGGHTTLDHYINVFDPAAFQRYFKFTFIRNPWDRLVSAYHFLKAGGMNRWDREFFERELSRFPDFHTFVSEWLIAENLHRHHHFKPQHGFLFDRYFKVTVDYIGQFENINADFNEIARRIGSNAVLEKTNHSNRRDYREYYDDETRDRVAQVYAADIALLGYSFHGDCSCPRRLDPRAARDRIEAAGGYAAW